MLLLTQDLHLPDSDDEDVVEMVIEQQHAAFMSKQKERSEQLGSVRIWSAVPSPSPVTQRQREVEQRLLVKQGECSAGGGSSSPGPEPRRCTLKHAYSI